MRFVCTKNYICIGKTLYLSVFRQKMEKQAQHFFKYLYVIRASKLSDPKQMVENFQNKISGKR